MKKNVRYLLIITALAGSVSVFAQSNIEKVRSAMLAGYDLNSRFVLPASAPPASTILASINTDGSFNRANPTPTIADLTTSIFKLMYVFEKPDSIAYYQTTAVKDKLYKSLNYWLGQYPAFAWTTSAMEQPSALGVILLKLSDNFLADQANPTYASLIAGIRARSNGFIRYSWSNGATKTTLTNPNLGTILTDDWHRMGNLGYRLFGYAGILAATGDSTSMDTLSTMVANQFAFQINKPNTPVIAALYDGSMHQHGPQTFNVGYGSDWLTALGRFAGAVKNSRWKLTTVQQQTWGDLLLNGMLWMYYKGRTAHNIVGRHTSKTGSLSGNAYSLFNDFVNVADASLPQYARINALKANLINPNFQLDSSKYLWNSHLILHHSPRYFASIKMLSSRTVGAESSDAASGQGLMNFHVADGSTMIYRTRNEYTNARVGWNWRAIPGATIKQKTGNLPLVPWSTGYESDNVLAGGVSDGDVSMGMFSLSRTNTYHTTKAIKSYFTFNDMLLCLGNSINDTDAASGDVHTTLNQCERVTDVVYKVNGGSEQTISLSSSADLNFSITSPSWFWHDSIGYVIIPSTTIATSAILKAETRTGNWYDLDKRNPNASVSVNVFQLSINHGSSVGWNDRTYRYVVVPAVSKAELIAFVANKIVTQDSLSLYINYNDSRIISASYNGYTGVFFSGAGVSQAKNLGPDNVSVSTTNYAAVLMKRSPGGLTMQVSDIRNGFYTNNSIQLGINRRLQASSFTPPRANRFCSITPASDTTRLSVPLSKTNSVYEGEPVQISALYAATTQDSLPTVADAYVRDGTYGTTNYGTATTLVVKKDGSSYARETYLKFNVNTLSMPVVNAKVRLYGSAGADASTTQWQLYKVADNTWTETGITWNNKPATTTLVATQTGKSALGYTEWDVTSQLQSQPSDGLLSFKLISTVTGSATDASFYSKESGTASYRPCLIFTTNQESSPNGRRGSTSTGWQDEGQPNEAQPDAVRPVRVIVFPNPVNTVCEIQADRPIRAISLVNTDGSVLTQLLGLDTRQATLPLTGLASGVYVVRVMGADFHTAQKIVKTN
ncbi:polysaccharide lyase family 8 super-sandwich domain-containing protein [Spirosoma endophyticum]|uniref:Por secretion system C-terminal sorting domain-containing protein n=1 Tax=Spirosoma endophyticum TaxID=662367 RepID=A0A1I2DSV6_9BACT|nr:polysaccharide lyase family 8 super-sandwich domain-containing protein [Spirosoma endophyticum]SFE83030.1 Por secretion system C-terminal sorting domain-containing protein [Spirosoma endophyticum]